MQTQYINHEEAVAMVQHTGRDVTIMLQGEPGIGKSSIGQQIADALGYPFAYLDMANMSLGDLMMPVINRDLKCTEFYPNDALKLHLGRPIVVMLDEWTKAGKEVKNMTLPLALERRLGSVKLHPESIVFATGNLTKDGVGDSIQAHQLNRFIPVHLRKPSAEEWINNFAINADVDPTVIAFVDQFPQVMESYIDDKGNDNPYIFNPSKQQRSYCSPRSLNFASKIVKQRQHMSDVALQAALDGAIGQAAAADLTNFVRMNESLPPFASICADPEGTSVPKEPVNRLLLTFNLLMRVDENTVKPVLKYVQRLNNEMQALFLNKLLSTSSKSAWAAKVKEVGAAVAKVHHIFSA